MAKVEEKKGALRKDELKDVLREMLLIRRFEEKVEERFRAGELPGFLHVAIGQEACAVGVCRALEEGDVIASTHRAHGHTLAKGTHPNELMAELYGKTEGCSHGYGGSMHLYDVEHGNMGANAVVGGGLPQITGAALAFQLRGEPRVAVAFFGDGATNIGTFHEALNLAQLWKVPAVFVLEDNHWAESTPESQHSPIRDLSERAKAFGMKAMKVDGQDVEAVYKAARQALEHARSGKGPVFVHLDTVRFSGHYIGDPQVYRDKDEAKELRATRDPIDDPARAARRHRRRVRGARRRGDGDRRGIRRVREERHRPRARRRAEEHLCLSSATAKQCATPSRPRCAQDDDVFIMGEDIAEMGGSMGVTHGMLEEFGPERVRNTPISEMALAGAAIGAALQGMRPVAEIMYEDFMTLAAEQVVNQAAKLRYMSGGQLTVPVVFRTQGGAGWSPGAQHAQQLEAWFVHIPGLKVVFASTPEDVRGLLWSSIYDDNPVVFFEHRTLYGIKGNVPEKIEPIPIGKARVHREGEDVTVIATGRLVHESLEARTRPRRKVSPSRSSTRARCSRSTRRPSSRR